MPELLKGVPVWFMIICIVILAGGVGITSKLLLNTFIKSLDKSFGVLNDTLQRFEKMFESLFDKNEVLENRLSFLEGAHNSNHSSFPIERQNSGRRVVDKKDHK